jgi:hypothetical protein
MWLQGVEIFKLVIVPASPADVHLGGTGAQVIPEWVTTGAIGKATEGRLVLVIGQTTSYYGDVRVDLEKRGLVIGPLDMLIAAHVLRLGATLVTTNFGEFQRVADLQFFEWK